MFNTILNYYSQFSEISKTNPLLAGIIGVWGAGIATYMFRNVPGSIYSVIKNQTRTILLLDNNSFYQNEFHFQAFLKWYTDKKFIKWSRTISLDGDRETQWNNSPERFSSIVIGIGYGSHYFFYKRRLFCVEKMKVESTAGNQKQELRITGFTRNQELIFDLINEFKYVVKSSEIKVYEYDNRNWVSLADIKKRDLKTVILNQSLKESILNDISSFIDDEEWYSDKGIPYKQCFLLHGKPGTGKTSLIKAIASYLNKNIYVINLSEMSDKSLFTAINSVPKNNIILIEDFDTNSSVKKRSFGQRSQQSPTIDAPVEATENIESQIQSIKDFSFMTMTGLLNTLDGIVSLDNTLLFLTTNHIENIDSAVIRKGRVDKIYEIPYLTNKEVHQYISTMFPDNEYDKNIEFKDIAGCDLQAIFLDNKWEFNNFLNSIPSKTTTLKQVA